MNFITAVPLDALAERIKADLVRRDQSREDWIAATADLFLDLNRARKEFQADRDFSKWLADNELGPNVLNDHDRAAAIAMGEDIDTARAVLEKTQRSSLQLIYTEEFQPLNRRVASASKPGSKPLKTQHNPHKPSVAKPKAPRSAAEQKHRNPKITAAAEQAVAAAVLDHGKSIEQATAEAGIGSMQVGKIAVAKERGRREALSEPKVEREDLSLSAQQKFDILIRRHIRDLDAAFEQRVIDEYRRRLDDWVLPYYQQKVDEADAVIKARKGVMTRALFRQILACLHPDNVQDEQRKKRFGDVFGTFRELELVLCSEKELPTETHGMPRTYEDLMKRRKVKPRR